MEYPTSLIKNGFKQLPIKDWDEKIFFLNFGASLKSSKGHKFNVPSLVIQD